MIGEIRKAITPFYDSLHNRQNFKVRPVLVLAKADSGDYTVLPVSRVTRRENLHPVYDVEVDPAVYPSLNLKAVSYIRTHKQTTIHVAEIGDVIGDLKNSYEDLYLEVLSKREQYSSEVASQALL